MVVINQVLVVGIGVNGFNVAILNTVLVIDGLQYRSDGVGGTGSSRQDLVFVGDPVVVDATSGFANAA